MLTVAIPKRNKLQNIIVLTPKDGDIKIEYTGLRPGEKLYEELLMAEEGMKETANKLIHIGKPIEMNEDEFFLQLADLKEACYQDDAHIKEKVAAMVPTYHIKK